MFYCQLKTFFEWLAFCVTIFFFFINVVLVFLYWSYLQKTMVIDWGALFQLARARSQMRKKHSNKKNRYSLELIIACTQLRFPYIIRTFMYKGARVFFSCCVRWAYPLVGSHLFPREQRLRKMSYQLFLTLCQTRNGIFQQKRNMPHLSRKSKSIRVSFAQP